TKIRYFFLTIAFSLGFYGFKGGIFSLATGGQFMVLGPGTSIIAANNSIGLALNMVLPFLWYLGREVRGYLKLVLYSVFVLTIPAIMFTYARASTITLAFVLLAIILREKYRVRILSAVLIAGLVAVPSIPQRWWDRQMTTFTYESDTSAMSRIDNWKFVWRV